MPRKEVFLKWILNHHVKPKIVLSAVLKTVCTTPKTILAQPAQFRLVIVQLNVVAKHVATHLKQDINTATISDSFFRVGYLFFN